MTLDEQFASLILMVLMGMWIGASFSIYQRFIHPRKGRRWILLLTDPLFWIAQAMLAFALLLIVNEGQLRLYLILAAALGFSAYKAMFERPFMFLLEGMISAVVQTWRILSKTLFHLIIYPVYCLLKLVYILCRMTVNTILQSFLFLLIFPLKIIRGILRMVLPERWLLSIKKWTIRTEQNIIKWISIVTRRR
ncbi:spore cortex biosynthesis protein YabQ [Sporolactobacillus sp. THM7-4]|nr:spore cortex biosynthesis protein YabQ [Sporolactobacillus sp. THM7-4]